MLDSTAIGSTDQLVGWLVTLDNDLGTHQDVKSSQSIDFYVDAEYCKLKETVRAILLEEGKLNPKAVERLEAIGVTVVFDKENGSITLYLHNGNFTVN
jgi:hypothetical protein